MSEAAARLAGLKGTPDCVPYCEGASLPGKKISRQVSIYGICSTGEVFVEVTDGQTTRVQSFVSRHKHCPSEVRREALPLVDAYDAHNLARAMCKQWPKPPPNNRW